jgi:bifunctional ADP-heptose synthase (sugar kinase/adenylyltransferase)
VDTRAKIVSPETAAAAARERRAAGERIKLATGYFDPLLSAHARTLGSLAAPGSALFVAIADPPQPILPARARAELVAALAAVDYVVLAPDSTAVEAVNAHDTHDERAADERRSRDLMRHVQSRQKR